MLLLRFTLWVGLLAPAPRLQPPPADAAELRGEVVRRRRAVLDRLQDGVLLLRSRPPAHRSRDITYRFHQESDLYYLTGLDTPGTALILSGKPLERLGRQILFVPTRPGRVHFETPPPTPAEVQAVTGLPPEAILPAGRLEAVLREALGVQEGARGVRTRRRLRLYYDFRGAERWGPRDRVHELVARIRRARGSRLRVRPPAGLLVPLRQVKSAYEIACIRRAIEGTVAGLRAAARELRPGMYEYELEAIIGYHCRRRGLQLWAFPPIIGSGPNGCILHYDRNTRRMRGGELVVVDVGGEYRHYAADVTRTFPVSGRFTPRQRRLYDLVLAAQEAGIAAVKPGAPFLAPHAAARRVLARGLKRLGLIEKESQVGRYAWHGTSHGVGLDVHDPTSIGGKLQPGMVLTVEPGLYFPEEGLGIRIEDDVLVTRRGPEVLSRGLPRAAAAIEALMGARKEGRDKAWAGR